MVFFSIILDIDWFYSNYFPSKLESLSEIEEMMGFPNEKNWARQISSFMIIMNVFLKLILVYVFSKKTKSGRRLKNRSWQYLYLFCPPTSKRLPKKLDEAIEQRIFSITWIEIFCAIGFFLIFGAVQTQLSWSSLFTVKCPLIPLNMIILMKGISSFIQVLGLLSHADLPDFLAEFGCIISKTWYKNRRQILREKRGFEAPKVMINKGYMSLNTFIKVLDLGIGVLMWIALVWAYNLIGRDTPKEIRVVLMILTINEVVADILVSSLYATVHW